MAGSPLAGMTGPRGDPAAAAALGARHIAAADALLAAGRQIGANMSGLNGATWMGSGAEAASSASAVLVAVLAQTVEALNLVGSGLISWSSAITAAQAQFAQAQTTASDALADEASHRSAAATMASVYNQEAQLGDTSAGSKAAQVTATAAAYSSPLRGQAQAAGAAAVASAGHASTVLAGQINQATTMLKPPPVHHGGFWSKAWGQVKGFGDGLYDGIAVPAKAIDRLANPGLYGLGPWEQLGKGLANDAEHPVGFLKGLVDYQDFSTGNEGRGVGELLPTIVAVLLTDGATSGASEAGRASDLIAQAKISGRQLAASETRPSFERVLNGSAFNADRSSEFEYNEVRTAAGRRVDSYTPFDVIVSRKDTQLAQIKITTATRYLNEAKAFYGPGTPIAVTPSVADELKGASFEGQLVLEVPPQASPIPPEILDLANRLDIRIDQVPFVAPIPVPDVRSLPGRALVGAGAAAGTRGPTVTPPAGVSAGQRERRP